MSNDLTATAIEGHALRAGGLADTTEQIERLTREAVDLPPVPIDDDGHHLVTVPDGYRTDVVHVVRPQRWNAAPDRRRGQTEHESAGSLARYVTEHHDAAATTVWVHLPSVGEGEIVAVLDDHEADCAGWGDHTARLPLVTSTAWRYWMSRNGHRLAHLDFAEHLEGGLAEISDPPAGDLLDLVRHIEMTRDVKFVSSTREGGLSSIRYTEDEDAKTPNRGGTEIPRQFTLTLPVFPGSAPLEVRARVLYRLTGDALSITYAIDRPESIVERAVEQLVTELTEMLPEPVREHVYRGTPIEPDDRERSGDWVSTDAVAR